MLRSSKYIETIPIGEVHVLDHVAAERLHRPGARSHLVRQGQGLRVGLPARRSAGRGGARARNVGAPTNCMPPAGGRRSSRAAARRRSPRPPRARLKASSRHWRSRSAGAVRGGSSAARRPLWRSGRRRGAWRTRSHHLPPNGSTWSLSARSRKFGQVAHVVRALVELRNGRATGDGGETARGDAPRWARAARPGSTGSRQLGRLRFQRAAADLEPGARRCGVPIDPRRSARCSWPTSSRSRPTTSRHSRHVWRWSRCGAERASSSPKRKNSMSSLGDAAAIHRHGPDRPPAWRGPSGPRRSTGSRTRSARRA